MHLRLVLVLICGLTIHPLAAQVCAGLVPLKPATLICSNPVPACVPNRNGIGGHWEWGCASETNGSGAAAAPWTTLLQQAPPPVAPINPAQVRMEAERLRSD